MLFKIIDLVVLDNPKSGSDSSDQKSIPD